MLRGAMPIPPGNEAILQVVCNLVPFHNSKHKLHSHAPIGNIIGVEMEYKLPPTVLERTSGDNLQETALGAEGTLKFNADPLVYCIAAKTPAGEEESVDDPLSYKTTFATSESGKDIWQV